MDMDTSHEFVIIFRGLGSISNKVDNPNENRSGSVFSFVGNSDENVKNKNLF